MPCSRVPRSIALSILLLSTLSFSASAQVDFKGIWQGYITAPGSYNSGYTLHIEEYAGDRISGTAYIYRNEDPIQFDGVLDFIGTVSKKINKITELVIIDGNDTHRVMIVSDKQKSAAVYLKYKPRKNQ